MRYLNVTSRIKTYSSAKVKSACSFPHPRNNKRSFIKQKELSFLLTHDEILFPLYKLWTLAAWSLFKFNKVSLFQVGFFLFDYLLYCYVVGDPGLFSKVAFVQQKHFAYKSWNALRSKLVRIRLFFNFPCCNHYMMTLLITTLLWCKIALKFRKLWIPWTSLQCYYGTLKKLTNQLWRDFLVN